MKNFLFITSVLVIFLSGKIIQAQKPNPFNVKKRTAINKQIPNPTILKSLTVAHKTNSNLSSVSYHSIPFNQGYGENRKDFRNLKFNSEGKLIFLQGEQTMGGAYLKSSRETVDKAALQYLSGIKDMIRIKEPEREFKTVDTHSDKYGFTHVKLQQFYNDIKVYGGQVFVHGTKGKMNKFNGEYFPTPGNKNTIPSISEEKAFEIVKNNLPVAFAEPTKTKLNFLNYDPVVSELVFYNDVHGSKETKLTWHLTVSPNAMNRYEYFIDAQDGNVLNYYDNTCYDGVATAHVSDLNGTMQTINTYLLNETYYLIDASRNMYNNAESELPDKGVGVIWTIDARNSPNNENMQMFHYTSSDNTWGEHPEAVSAHYNAGETYEYYLNTHGRNAINGKNGTIISICNITNDDGTSMENAFWNGKAMFYGNGGNIFSPLAGALDVGAHEMGHGVIQNTCNLEYQDESGALNESMADISGTMVDRANWFLGEDVIINKSTYPTGHLRDMSNPHNGGTSLNDICFQPAHINEKYSGTQDNGGVHINSGIMNFAYYKFATAIGKDKAEKIWYKAMTDYLVKLSRFADARVAFVQSSTDIFGAESAETEAVKNAFTEVGITDGGNTGGGTPGQGDLQVNPGQDYILSSSTDEYDSYSLYVSTTDASSENGISKTQLKQKPSVTDDGSLTVFVTVDNNIKYINMNTGEEGFISSDGIFDNVVISKDGQRLAIISTQVDSAIWVYDFGLEQMKKYHLFNPTFSTGIVTNNVLYADAIEWDYSGQHIIYDAYNKMKNASGDDIDYWDMNTIRVWDNASGNWGDGKIEKIFTNLPEGVSVGNPTLSKNSPYIIAFDYFDANTDDAAVMAANILTGDIDVIFENTVLGYPNYSKNDDKLIFNATDNSGEDVIGEIALQQDKISPSGDPFVLMSYRTWGVWYASGTREINTGIKEQKTAGFTVYPNPAVNTLNVLLTETVQPVNNLVIYDIMGRPVMKKQLQMGVLLYHIDISLLPKGTYFVNCTVGNNSLSKKFIKM